MLQHTNNYIQTTVSGKVDSSNEYPYMKENAVYTLNNSMASINSGGTSGINTENEFYCLSGLTAGNIASIYTKKVLPLSPGTSQGCVLDGRFTEPTAGVRTTLGLSNGTDSLAFGYQGLTFGIFYRHHGAQQIMDLFVTTASSAATDATLTLSGTAYIIPLTINATIAATASNIATGLNSVTNLWRAQAIGNKVVIRSILSLSYPGAYTFSHGTATANFVQIAAGTPLQEVFTAQNSWDSLYDETQRKLSEWFDPQKGNVYKIEFNYGYGLVYFQILIPSLGRFSTFHTMNFINRTSRPFLNNPNFRLTLAVRNDTNSTANAGVYSGSMYGFIDGQFQFYESSHSISSLLAPITTTGGTVLNLVGRETFGDKVNLKEAEISAMTFSSTSTKDTIIEVLKNTTINGRTNLQYVSENESYVLYGTTNNPVTGGYLIDTIVIPPAAGLVSIDFRQFRAFILPGETISFVARVSSGAAAELTTTVAIDEFM